MYDFKFGKVESFKSLVQDNDEICRYPFVTGFT